MANKSAFGLLLLLALSATIEGASSVRVKLASGSLTSRGWFGRKTDFYYRVPANASYVAMEIMDHSWGGGNFGSGNGKATLSWTRGSSTAKVHAWVNGFNILAELYCAISGWHIHDHPLLFDDKLQQLFNIYKEQNICDTEFEGTDDDFLMEILLTVEAKVLFNNKRNVVSIEKLSTS